MMLNMKHFDAIAAVLFPTIVLVGVLVYIELLGWLVSR